MKYIKIYDNFKPAKFNIDDIVIFKNNMVKIHGSKTITCFIIKIYEEDFDIYYDLESVYNCEFGYKYQHLSVSENRLQKVSKESEERIRLDLKVRKYNI